MKKFRCKTIAVVGLVTILGGPLGIARSYAQESHGDDRDNVGPNDRNVHTSTPIKHVIVLIGENRTFDNVYGTYVPRHGQHISNLLSRGIVNSDGSPGPNSAAAEQFRVSTINPVTYFVDTKKLVSPGKAAYAPFLPTPEAGSAPPRAVTLAQFQKDPAPSAPPFEAGTFSLKAPIAGRGVQRDQHAQLQRAEHRDRYGGGRPGHQHVEQSAPDAVRAEVHLLSLWPLASCTWLASRTWRPASAGPEGCVRGV
jgi:hypothetical protein